MRNLSVTVPSRSYSVTARKRDFYVTVPARAYYVTVPKRDTGFLNTANRRTEYDPDYWVRWGQQNVWPFLPDAEHAGMTMEEIEERAQGYP